MSIIIGDVIELVSVHKTVMIRWTGIRRTHSFLLDEKFLWSARIVWPNIGLFTQRLQKQFSHDFCTGYVCDFSEASELLLVWPASHAMGHDPRFFRGRMPGLRKLWGRRPDRASDWGCSADETFARSYQWQRQARRLWEWRGVTQVGAVTDPSSLHDDKRNNANAESADDGVRAQNREDWAPWS